VGVAGLGVGDPGLARSAETSASTLEVSKDVFHQSSFGWEMCGAAMEIAWERSATSNRSLGFHCTAGSNDGVLLTGHALVEKVGILSGDLSDWWHDGWHIGVFLCDMSTWTRANVPILCRPRLEPVGASRAASSVGGNLVEMELNDEVSKVGVDVCATLLRACEEVLARRGIVDGYSAVVRLDVLSLIASECLARDELGWGKCV
jgi:hypothetical protein